MIVVAAFSKEHLRHSYIWSTPESECKAITGFPETETLNCMEGYEVLHFVNRYLDEIGWCTQTSFNNVESLVKTRRPIYLRKHSEVKQWLDSMLRKPL